MSDQIYRVHRSIRLTHSATSSRTEYITSLEDLASNLLRWRLESERETTRQLANPGRFARIWLDFLDQLGFDVPEDKEATIFPHTIDILSVQRHTDEGWIDFPWSYSKPSVLVGSKVFL